MNAARTFPLAFCCVAALAIMVLQSGCQKTEPAKPSAPAAKEAAKPAAQPAEEPAATAPIKPAAAPAEKPAVERAAEPPPAPAAQPAAPPAAAPAEKPAAEHAAEPPPASAAPPAAPPAAEPAGKPGQPMAAVPAVPLGLPPLPVPADNPMPPEKVDLGKMLYFDRRVSKDGTISCASCHDPQAAWTEHSPTSEGLHRLLGARNSPTVINAAYATSQFWDGRAASLEDQALGPVENPVEMGHSMKALVTALEGIPGYRERFQKVFGTGVTEKGFAQAIAAFERTILSGDSPYDRFVQGDQNALGEAQKRGWKLFDDHCTTCHTPPLFSNYRFFNAGVAVDRPQPDEGRKKVTGDDRDLGKFRVPALREAANTYPYFHDGSAATLEDAVALMAGGGKDNPNLSEQMKALRSAKLTEQDRKDIVEFLRALSGKYPVVEPPALP